MPDPQSGIVSSPAPAGGGGPDDATVQQTRALVDVWKKRVEAAKKREGTRVSEFPRYRTYLTRRVNDDGEPGQVRVPLIFVNQATIIPRIYAKNPEISVSPTKGVEPTQYEIIKKFCTVLEAVLEREFVRGAKLKERMKSNMRSVYATSEGWVKLTYQRDYKEDPIIRGRLNDAQDNIARIRRLIADAEDPAAAEADQEAALAELNVQIKAMQEQVEVLARQGLVLDRVLSEDMLILDDTIKDFECYVDADALAMGVWFTQDRYKELFGWPEDGAQTGTPTTYSAPVSKETQDNAKNAQPKPDPQHYSGKFVRVWEIWHKGSNTVYTWAEGLSTWCRDPYQPDKLGSRWYPFFRQGWNLVDGSKDAQSDVEMQMELQDEYNTTRTQYRDHRRDSMPVRVVRDGGSLTPEDVKKLSARRSRDTIVVTGTPGHPITEDVHEFPNIAINPEVYETNTLRSEMEMVAGRGDASAGTVATAKTATEAEILREGLMTRSSERQDINEDLIAEMAQYAAEILLQELTPQQVAQIAGKSAVQYWPKLDKNTIFDFIQIEIRAGSMGRPNRQQDRQQWTELFPVLTTAVQQIFQFREQGQLALADAMGFLLKETLTRFDERIDIERLIGPIDGGQAPILQALYQQLLEARQIIAKLTGAPAPAGGPPPGAPGEQPGGPPGQPPGAPGAGPGPGPEMPGHPAPPGPPAATVQ